MTPLTFYLGAVVLNFLMCFIIFGILQRRLKRRYALLPKQNIIMRIRLQEQMLFWDCFLKEQFIDVIPGYLNLDRDMSVYDSTAYIRLCHAIRAYKAVTDFWCDQLNSITPGEGITTQWLYELLNTHCSACKAVLLHLQEDRRQMEAAAGKKYINVAVV
jgi:hypothetical protein